MTSQTRHILLFAVLVLLSFALWRYYFYQEKIIVDKPFTKGYSVENIELRITDESGAMSAKFKSPSLISYTDSPVVHIDSPKFWTYNNGIQQWEITSEKALYDTSLDEVVLEKDLIAKTINTDAPTSFEAKNLTIDLNTKLAHTEDGISLQKQQFNMQGQIAKIDLNNEILEVNKNVKAIYKAID